MTEYTNTPRPEVCVDVPAAALLITASEREGVDVSIEPSNPDKTVDREAVERVTVTDADGTVSIVGEKRLLLGTKGSVEVRLDVPAGTDLTASIAAGSVRLRGHLGAVKVKTSAGDVTGDTMVSLGAKVSSGSVSVAEVADGVDVHLSSGEAQFGRIGGRGKIKSGHGGILIEELSGESELITATGGITLGAVDGDVAARSGHGVVRAREVRSGRLDIESGFGTIEVGIAPGAPVWVDADSKNGVVRTDLESDAGPLGDEKPVEVHARTKFGDIAIDRVR